MGDSTATASTDNDPYKLDSTNNKLQVFRQLTGINSDRALELTTKGKLAVFCQLIRKLVRRQKTTVDPPPTRTKGDAESNLAFDVEIAVSSRPTQTEGDPESKPAETPGRPASNLGIYARTVRAEDRAKLLYTIFSFLINACLGIQIIVAASLTALGAGNGPHRVVTGFGAINTIIAGFLTYLKGSGLPDRYKHQQNWWGEVREYIEQRERDFYSKGCALKVKDEIYIIECMYKDVRNDTKPSIPDKYGSSKRGDEESSTRHAG